VRVGLISRHEFSNRLEFRAAPILTGYSGIDESIVETGHNSQMQTFVCYQMKVVQDVDNRRSTERSSMNTTERMRENLKKCRDRLKEMWHPWWWCSNGGGG
jgi:hypothetical protein